MPKHTRRWVDLDGLRILRRLEFLTEHTIDDGGMIDLWAPVAFSAVEFEHPDSHPYHPIRNVDAEQDLFDLSCITELTRYNSRGAYAAAISDDLALQSVTDRMLEAHCHMHRSSFDFIFSLIRDHSCFEIDSVKGGRPQISPRWQLFVALSRFVDSEGTTRSFGSHFKISKGTVIAVSLRVCSAITSVERRFLRWPSAARRRVLADFGDSEFGFPGYIGNQDGTHFYFKYAPAYSLIPETFYDTMHSGGYGYNVLLVADHTGSVIHYSLGWPGSVHDASIQQHSLLFRNQWNFFEKGQYLFVDTGFLRTMTAVSPYKGPAAHTPPNKVFNRAMREGRCRIEHVNAIVKSRFKSLKKIPIRIQRNEDHDTANLWIRACLVLHNILIRVKDEWEFYQIPEEFEGPDYIDDAADVEGAQFQDMVRDRWLQRTHPFTFNTKA